MRLNIYRYNPDKDAKPYMKDYDVPLEQSDRMLLDVLVKVKAQDDSFSFRRSCREGVCGSDAMNINGKNGLACIVRIADLKEPVVIRLTASSPIRATRPPASASTISRTRTACSAAARS